MAKKNIDKKDFVFLGNPNAEYMFIFPTLSSVEKVIGEATLSYLLDVPNFTEHITYDNVILTAVIPEIMKEDDIKKYHENAYVEDFLDSVRLRKPKYIVTFGNFVLQQFVKSMYEKKADLYKEHGTIYTWHESVVMSTFHPRQLVNNLVFKEAWYRDWERFFSIDINNVEEPSYHLVRGFNKNAWRLHKYLFLDLESTGLDYRKDTVISIGFKTEGRNVVDIITHPTNETLLEILKAAEELGLTVVGHNIKFDLLFMCYKAGYIPVNLKVEDTQIYAHVQGQEILNLKHLSNMNTLRLGNTSYARNDGFSSLTYLAEDVITTEIIYNIFSKGKNTSTEIANKCIIPLVNMQLSGIALDLDTLGKQELEFIQKRDDLFVSLQVISNDLEEGFNLNPSSPKQVVKFLQLAGIELTETTESGALSVGAEVLSTIEHPYVKMLLEYRELEKVLGYVTKYIEMSVPIEGTTLGKLHPSIKMTGTETGRWSSENPNIQQIPNKFAFKKVFKSRFGVDGRMCVIDLSAAELRLAAITSGDEVYARALALGDIKGNPDGHRQIAGILFGLDPNEVSKTQRSHAKAVTFGLLYGGTPRGIAHTAGLPENIIKDAYNRYFASFKGLGNWLNDIKEFAAENLYVQSIFGHIRRFKNLSVQQNINAVKRAGCNTPIQSASSQVTNFLMYKMYHKIKQRNMKTKLVATIHDSVVFDVPNETEQSMLIEIFHEVLPMLWELPELANNPVFHILPIKAEYNFGETFFDAEAKEEQYEFNIYASGEVYSHVGKVA